MSAVTVVIIIHLYLLNVLWPVNVACYYELFPKHAVSSFSQKRILTYATDAQSSLMLSVIVLGAFNAMHVLDSPMGNQSLLTLHLFTWFCRHQRFLSLY